MFAGVRGVVDAGLLAWAGGHEECFVGGEGYDGAEIERFSAGDLCGLPELAIGRAEICAMATGGPGDFF